MRKIIEEGNNKVFTSRRLSIFNSILAIQSKSSGGVDEILFNGLKDIRLKQTWEAIRSKVEHSDFIPL